MRVGPAGAGEEEEEREEGVEESCQMWGGSTDETAGRASSCGEASDDVRQHRYGLLLAGPARPKERREELERKRGRTSCTSPSTALTAALPAPGLVWSKTRPVALAAGCAT